MGYALSYHSGLAAENQVAQCYAKTGAQVQARRWRGLGGEIDLIIKEAQQIVFVEVKRSKTHAQAVSMLSFRQIQRIKAAAVEFLANEPQQQNTECRFDVALVDALGQIEILHNALAD